MSQDIQVNVTRTTNGVTSTITSDLSVQLDAMNPMEASYYNGAVPYFTYNCYLLTNELDIRFGDLMTDTTRVDPITATNYRYRVISYPEPFPDGHTELVAEQVRGT